PILHYPLLHDALPISFQNSFSQKLYKRPHFPQNHHKAPAMQALFCCLPGALHHGKAENNERINTLKITHKIQNILSRLRRELKKDRKSTRLNSSHVSI